MNIKKILTFIMSLVMCFLLCSCHNSFSKLRKYVNQFECMSLDYELISGDNFCDLIDDSVDGLEYEITSKNNHYYINGNYVCKYPYELEISKYNTIVVDNLVYSLGAFHEDYGPLLHVYDMNFNVLEVFNFQYGNYIYSLESYSLLNLYDGLYMFLSSRSYGSCLQKLDIENNHLGEIISVNTNRNYSVFSKYYDNMFQVKNFETCSYLIINNVFYKFSNNKIFQCGDGNAICFGNISEDMWSFYNVSQNEDYLIINLISENSNKEIISYKLLEKNLSNNRIICNIFFIKNYIVMEIIHCNIGYTLLGLLFYDFSLNTTTYLNNDFEYYFSTASKSSENTFIIYGTDDDGKLSAYKFYIH